MRRKDERCGDFLDLLTEFLFKCSATAAESLALSSGSKRQLLSCLFDLSVGEVGFWVPTKLASLRGNVHLRPLTQTRAFADLFQLSKYRSCSTRLTRRRD